MTHDRAEKLAQGFRSWAPLCGRTERQDYARLSEQSVPAAEHPSSSFQARVTLSTRLSPVPESLPSLDSLALSASRITQLSDLALFSERGHLPRRQF